MLYQVFIAICLSTMAPDDCDIHNAVGWMLARQFSNSPSASLIPRF
jgi:hypothetical protein